MSSPSGDVGGVLQVGGQRVPLSKAEAWVSAYFDRNHTSGWFAYPYYDALVTNNDPNVICGGDLLATTLLNASLSIEAFAVLRDRVPQLEDAVRAIPVDLVLTDADDNTLALLGPVYAVLDESPIPGVRGTKLSKVLHRKRPGFIPLYDKYVGRCYQVGHAAPLPVVKGRGWAEFMPLLGREIRKDLNRDVDAWTELAAQAPSVPVSLLRVLDIVAWNQGQRITVGRTVAEED